MGFMDSMDEDQKKRVPSFLTMGLALAMLVIGAVYFNDCRFNCTLYLVIGGAISLGSGILGLVSAMTKTKIDDKIYDKLAPLVGLANFAVFIWGSYEIFSNYSEWNYENVADPNFCAYTPMMFAFVQLIICWVLLPLFIFCCCTAACIGAVCACCKKGDGEAQTV